MRYLVANTSEFRINQNNNSGVAEIDIKLGLHKPTVTLKNKASIAGVFAVNGGKKNPGMPFCEVHEKKPTTTNEYLSVSSNTKNEITLNLKTKLKQL